MCLPESPHQALRERMRGGGHETGAGTAGTASGGCATEQSDSVSCELTKPDHDADVRIIRVILLQLQLINSKPGYIQFISFLLIIKLLDMRKTILCMNLKRGVCLNNSQT